MDPGISFALIGALVWGVYLFALKQYFADIPATVLVVYANSFALLWYAPMLGRSLGVGGTLEALSVLGGLQIAVLIVTSVLVAGAILTLLLALAAGDVSYVAPISKIVPVFVLPIEVLVLGQLLGPLQVAGVVVATVAVYVANYHGGSLVEPIRRAATSRAAQLALLSAMLFAVSDVTKRIGLQELAIPSVLWVPLLLGGVLVVVLPVAVRDHPSTIRPALPKLAVLGGVLAAGEYVTTLAFALVPASIASPIINTQAIIAVLLGGILLGEQYFRTRLLAALLAVVGVTMIAL